MSETVPVIAQITPDLILDSRRALIHPGQGWMAVSDIHYGYEVHRNLQGALFPGWGMEKCLSTLRALLEDHRPQRLILVGDIMDGSGSVIQTGAFLNQLREEVAELVLIEGNHDRTGLKKGWQMQRTHQESGFLFHHGHRSMALPSVEDEPMSSIIWITGHEHPAVSLNDGAGLRLKLPALVRQRLSPEVEHWILPAFSPWAAGGEYRSEHERLATWVCAPTRVWEIF